MGDRCARRREVGISLFGFGFWRRSEAKREHKTRWVFGLIWRHFLSAMPRDFHDFSDSSKTLGECALTESVAISNLNLAPALLLIQTECDPSLGLSQGRQSRQGKQWTCVSGSRQGRRRPQICAQNRPNHPQGFRRRHCAVGAQRPVQFQVSNLKRPPQIPSSHGILYLEHRAIFWLCFLWLSFGQTHAARPCMSWPP